MTIQETNSAGKRLCYEKNKQSHMGLKKVRNMGMKYWWGWGQELNIIVILVFFYIYKKNIYNIQIKRQEKYL